MCEAIQTPSPENIIWFKSSRIVKNNARVLSHKEAAANLVIQRSYNGQHQPCGCRPLSSEYSFLLPLQLWCVRRRSPPWLAPAYAGLSTLHAWTCFTFIALNLIILPHLTSPVWNAPLALPCLIHSKDAMPTENLSMLYNSVRTLIDTPLEVRTILSIEPTIFTEKGYLHSFLAIKTQ